MGLTALVMVISTPPASTVYHGANRLSIGKKIHPLSAPPRGTGGGKTPPAADKRQQNRQQAGGGRGALHSRRMRFARERMRIVPVLNGHDAAGERPTTDGQPTTNSRGALNPPSGADAGGTGGGTKGGAPGDRTPPQRTPPAGRTNPAARSSPPTKAAPTLPTAIKRANKGAHASRQKRRRATPERALRAIVPPLRAGGTAPCAVPERALRAIQSPAGAFPGRWVAPL